MRSFDIVIVGGGVTAAVMANVLVARKVVGAGRVAIVSAPTAERDAHTATSDAGAAPWDLRVFALSAASQRLLSHCGVWPLLPDSKRGAYERMCVWDAAGEPGGRGSLTFDCALLNEPNLGHIVEGRELALQARRAAVAAGVVFIEARVAGIVVDDRQVRLALDDGRDVAALMLIGADGTESPTRALLGIETAGHTYPQDALVAHVRTAKPHRRTAWQRFLPTGPLALLPLPDGRSSLVWSMERGAAGRLRALDRDAFGAALTAASGECLGACELTTDVVSLPLQLQYALEYVRPRVALVGDAAHAVHPLAGQGLNLGLLDAASLAASLEGTGAGGRLGDYRALRRYERWRRSENLLAATAFDGLERLFGSDNPLIGRARMMGLGLVGRAPWLRNALAARALGTAGDVPEFLQSGG